MELWLTEQHTDGYSVSWKIKETLHVEKTRYQHLAIVDTVDFGRALVLDGILQTTEKDEFVYHEMITHVPMFSHPNPRRVLVIGGGDGGTIKEVLKHPEVEKAVLCEIDERVIENSRRFLPTISSALDDPRVEIRVEDGIEYIKKFEGEFDVVIVDSSDPVGPATVLFGEEFYRGIFKALTEDGIFVAQTESPLFNKEFLLKVYRTVAAIFPIARIYLTAIATYIGGYWGFTLGSKKYDPATITPSPERWKKIKTDFYNPEMHRAAFALPEFFKRALQEAQK
ncbi:MAG: spermidine synthase [Eubacteriales bacterium]|nr:spermidine synthase [Eubacteriales bacterium]MDN5363766.1 spermidine synthase [Eubacteriales bacterium]